MSPTAALKAYRLNRGLSIREAADEIGDPVNFDILQRAEKGATPRPKAMKKIADFYEVQVTDIWPVEETAGAPS